MEETLSIIKYRPLKGCEDLFEEELKKLFQIYIESGKEVRNYIIKVVSQ